MYHFLSYAHFFASILYLILGVLIVVKAPRSPLNQACAGVILCFFIWSFLMTWVHHPATTLQTAERLGAVATVGWLYFNSFHLWFAWIFTKQKVTAAAKVAAVFVFAVPTLLLVMQLSRSALVGSFIHTPYGWFGPWADTFWSAFYFIYCFAMAIGGFALILRYGMKSDNRFIRRQSLILIITGVITLGGSFLFNIILTYITKDRVPPVADIIFLVWACGLAYVAIRYNMLNITPFIAADRIITTMKDLLFLLDTHGYVISTNISATQTLKCKDYMLTARNFRDLITGEEREKDGVVESMLQKDSFTVETELACAPGPAIPVALSTSLIPGTGVVCVAHDISLQKQRTESLQDAKRRLETRVSKATEELQRTNIRLTQEVVEKKEAAAALKESEMRFRVIFECAPDGIFLTDTDGTLLDANQEALRIVGYEKNDLVGRKITETGLLLGDNLTRANRMLSGETAGEKAGYEELFLRHRVGSMVPVEISTHPLKLGEKNLFIGIVRDLSMRKHAEKEAEELRKELQQAQKMEAIGRLAGGVAHDFNNLLGGIIGYSGIVRTRLGEKFPEEAKIMQKIITVSKQASDRTAQLLAFARKGNYRIEPVDMHKVIDEVVSLMEHTVDPRIVLRKEYKAEVFIVNGDRSQLHSAVLNLGVNARDALPDGGRIVFSTDNIMCSGPSASEDSDDEAGAGMYFRIAVSDNGTGMDEAIRARVFEPFFSTKDEDKGTGLGLASVYGTVKQHDGFIDLETSPGSGSTFILRFPVVAAQVNIAPAPEESEKESRCCTGKILVVDDTPLVREMMAEALEDSGYSVQACDNGYEALAWYRSHFKECNLVILDFTMPELNGKECFLAMKEIHPSVRAIISSGHAKDGEIAKTFDAGVREFLQKPFEIEDLLNVVGSVLEECDEDS